MLILRVALAAAVIAAAFHAIRERCYFPFQCNRVKKRAEAATSWAMDHSGSIQAALMARRVNAELIPCIEHCPAAVNTYMIAAANYAVLHRIPEAIVMYERALRYDRRPEIYFELGMAYLEVGQRDRAISALLVWRLFYARDTGVIFDPSVRAEVDALTRRFIGDGAHVALPSLLRDQSNL